MKLSIVQPFAFAAAMAFVSQAHGGPLKSSRVAADAGWLAHIDVEALAKSQFVQFVMTHRKGAVKMDGLDEFKEEFGVDLLKDVKDITAYGNGNPEGDDGRFVAVVTATATVDQMIAKLKTDEAESFSESVVEGYAIQSFKDDDEDGVFFHRMAGPAEGDRVMVVSKQTEQIIRAIKVLEGKAPNLEHEARLAHAPRPGSFFYASSDGVAWMHGHDPDDHHDPASAVLRDAKSLALDVGETGENSFADLTIGTEKGETASNITDILRGLLAMGKMAATSDPELASLKTALDGVRLKSTDNAVNVQLTLPTQSILQVLATLHDEDDEHADDEADHDDHDDHARGKKSGHRIEVGVKVGTKESD